METSHEHEHPRCPIDGAALICPSCRAREIGRKGGAARTKAKSDAAKKAARRPEVRRRRTEAQLAAWERRRATTGAPAPARAAPRRRTRKAQDGPGQESTVEFRPEIPPEVPAAARPEPAGEHSSSDQPDAPAERRASLLEALAKRRG